MPNRCALTDVPEHSGGNCYLMLEWRQRFTAEPAANHSTSLHTGSLLLGGFQSLSLTSPCWSESSITGLV